MLTPPGRLKSGALVAAIAIVACAAPESSSRSETAATAAPAPEALFRTQLGHSWELVRMGDQDIPAPAAGRAPGGPGRHPGPGSRPTIRFTAEATPAGSAHPPGMPGAGGWSFCNGYGTAYDLGPGGSLRFHAFESTLVGCDGPDSLETRFFRGLHETRRFEIDSARLALVAEDGNRLTFRLVADSASR